MDTYQHPSNSLLHRHHPHTVPPRPLPPFIHPHTTVLPPPLFLNSMMLNSYRHHGLVPPYHHSSQLVDAHDAAALEHMLFLQRYGRLQPGSENIPANNRVSSYDRTFEPSVLPPPRRFNGGDETIIFNDASLDGLSPGFYHQEDETILLEDLSDHRRYAFTSNGGLSEATVVKKMKMGIIGKHDDHGEVCVVCQDEFQETDRIGMLDNCTHVCHQECMKNWLMRKNLCPVCKAVGLN